MIRGLDKVWLLFFIWLVVGSTGLYYIKYGKLQLFDPKGKLAIASSSQPELPSTGITPLAK